MHLAPYRHVLTMPGVRPLMLVALLARMPAIAAGLALTLHVVLDLERGYAAAAAVGGAMTVGGGLGAPLFGRFIDRRGLRHTLLITTLAEAVFWIAAPVLPYPVLVPVAFVGGLLAIPVFGVVRQSLAALVPAEHRRPAYSLDSMSVELSFMAGPAIVVAVATTVSPRAAAWFVGAAMVLAGVSLYLLNPPIVNDEERQAPQPAVRQRWLGPRFIAILVATTGATFVLGGTDVAVIAMLRESGQLQWTGLVLAAWGAYSLAGGFVFGAVRRGLPAPALLMLLALLTVPVGIAGGWQWLCLVLIPAGVLCAPTLAATADSVSRLVPAGVRGEAMGWYSTALTLGMALGGPAVGAVVDRNGPAWGFAAAGTVGALLAVVAVALFGWRPSRPRAAPAEPMPAEPIPAEPVPVERVPADSARASRVPATTA